MHDSSLDTIDKLMEQGKDLKKIAQLSKQLEDLTLVLKEASVDDPVNILKEVIANYNHPENLPKRYIESGLYDMVKKLIGREQYVSDYVIRMMEEADKKRSKEEE